MKIYLATGFSVINNKGRERELSNKFIYWNRLQSFFFKEIWSEETFKIIEEKLNEYR